METESIYGFIGARISQHYGYLLRVPIIRTRLFLGSTLWSLYLGKLPSHKDPTSDQNLKALQIKL